MNLSYSEATLLLFLKSHRGPQNIGQAAQRAGNSLVMMGFADRAEGGKLSINWSGIDFAYRNL